MTTRTTGLARPINGLATVWRRVADVIAECSYAQRRMFSLTTSADLYLDDANHAPDTYAEFLFRTSGSLLHEPAAAGSCSRHGRPVG